MACFAKTWAFLLQHANCLNSEFCGLVLFLCLGRSWSNHHLVSFLSGLHQCVMRWFLYYFSLMWNFHHPCLLRHFFMLFMIQGRVLGTNLYMSHAAVIFYRTEGSYELLKPSYFCWVIAVLFFLGIFRGLLKLRVTTNILLEIVRAKYLFQMDFFAGICQTYIKRRQLYRFLLVCFKSIIEMLLKCF